MGRGPGAVTLVALPPARAWRRDASSAVPGRRWRADASVEAPNGRGHLALCCGRSRPQPVRLAGLTASGRRGAAGAPRGGPCLRAAPAPGCARPAGGAVPARRARPSLRQWVWTRVGEKGEGRRCLLPLPPPLFRLRTRGAIFLPRVTSLRYRAKPGGWASEDKTGLLPRREAAIGAEILASCCYGVEHWDGRPGSSWGLAALFVGRT